MGKSWRTTERKLKLGRGYELRGMRESEKAARRKKSKYKLRGKDKEIEKMRKAAGEESESIRKSCSLKTRYKTEKQAMNAYMSDKMRLRKLSAYQCAVCGGWHLTHKRPDPTTLQTLQW